MWTIIGEYKGKKEIVDSAETLKEIRFMISEYRRAYGNDWILSIKRSGS
jgi:hypothetical protein|tara:strand:- start:24156 stop:24302 length:147 start_codon:yes stop_codon:yes gene_type:complete